MSGTRRDFLRTVGVLGLGGAATDRASAPAAASDAAGAAEDSMGVLVDITKCVGCRRCEFACQEGAQRAAQARGEATEAALFQPDPMDAYEDKSVFDQPRLRRPEPHCHTMIARFPNPKEEAKPLYVKYNCMHCLKPACASACLVGAFRKLPTGPVVYDAWKCMGCRYCMVACPFGIPTYEYDNALTPQVRKCTLCSDEGNPNKGRMPACVRICPAEVMTYGRRADLLEVAAQRIQANPEVYAQHIYGAHEVGGTAWLYLAPKGQAFKDLGFVDLGSQPPPMRTESIQHGVFKHFVPPLTWYGLLGAAMWVTRTRINGNGAGPAGGHPGHEE